MASERQRQAAWERIEGHIADSIASHRARLELSQLQLSQETGLSQGQISSFETSNRLPTLPSIWRLCNALGISATDLLGF